MWKELKRELILNNAIVKRRKLQSSENPSSHCVWFFSSRRSLTVLERMLTYHGYEVISFNLGGLFGVFLQRYY